MHWGLLSQERKPGFAGRHPTAAARRACARPRRLAQRSVCSRRDPAAARYHPAQPVGPHESGEKLRPPPRPPGRHVVRLARLPVLQDPSVSAYGVSHRRGRWRASGLSVVGVCTIAGEILGAAEPRDRSLQTLRERVSRPPARQVPGLPVSAQQASHSRSGRTHPLRVAHHACPGIDPLDQELGHRPDRVLLPAGQVDLLADGRVAGHRGEESRDVVLDKVQIAGGRGIPQPNLLLSR